MPNGGWSDESLLDLLRGMAWQKNKDLTLDDVAQVRKYITDPKIARTTAVVQRYLECFNRQRDAVLQIQVWSSILDPNFGMNHYQKLLRHARALEDSFKGIRKRDRRTVTFAKYWTDLDDSKICQILRTPAGGSTEVYRHMPAHFKKDPAWFEVPTRLYIWIRRNDKFTYHCITHLDEVEVKAFQELLQAAMHLPPTVTIPMKSAVQAKQAAIPRNALVDGLDEPTWLETCLQSAYDDPGLEQFWKRKSGVAGHEWDEIFTDHKHRMLAAGIEKKAIESFADIAQD
ncbi:MAG: hypothetical protein Q9222_007485 [Ikaeria aurantiellina]